MIMATSTRNTIRFLDLLSKWEGSQQGAHSNIRDRPKHVQYKVGSILAPLTDDEMMVAFEVIGMCDQCDENKKNDALNKAGVGDGISPRRRRFINFLERNTGHKHDYEAAQYSVLLAPAWLALNGTGGDPGYSMGQATYRHRDEFLSTSPEPFLKGDRKEELLALLIGRMMQTQVGGIRGIADEDAVWFGTHWREVATVWQSLLKSDVFDRERVHLLIEQKRNGVPNSILGGAL